MLSEYDAEKGEANQDKMYEVLYLANPDLVKPTEQIILKEPKPKVEEDDEDYQANLITGTFFAQWKVHTHPALSW